MAHATTWFQIPATDIQRAKKFYEAVLGIALQYQLMGAVEMASFPVEKGEIGGALIQGDNLVPSATGTCVFLNGGPDLAVPLARVEAAGGKVAMPKTLITEEIGHFGMFHDTEGNVVGLFSPPA